MASGAGDVVMNVRVSGYWSKWLTFSAATMVMLSAGLGYTFSIWSNMLKTHFGYSQTQVAGVGTAGNLGGYLAVFAGLFYDAFRQRTRLGPWLTLMIGVVVHVTGYLGLWFAAQADVQPPYWLVLLLAVVACNGQTWFETGAMVTCVRNFETERGTVIGILKAFLGLSASMYTTVYISFLDPNAVSFLMLLAVGPAATVFVMATFINYVPYIQVEPHTKSHAFHLAFTSVVGLAAYQAAIAFARSSGVIEFWAGFLVTSAVAILLLPILTIPWIFGGLKAMPLNGDDADASTKEEQEPDYPPELETFRTPLLEDEAAEQINERFQDTYRDKTPIKCLRSQSFWLLFAINAIGSGAGLTLLNNLGQQLLALDPKSTSASVFVSVFSISNCIGRLCSGFLPDRLLRDKDMPRTVSIIALMLLTTLTSALNAFATLPLLAASSFLTGLAFGGMQGVVPAVTSEIFGLRNFATNYALLQLGPALGSYLLATFLAGELYEWTGERHGDKAGTCRGGDCFRYTFLVIAGLSLVASFLAILLWRRTTKLYEKVVEVTRKERQKRGLAGEKTRRQNIMRRLLEENKLLLDVVQRGRARVGQLQEQLQAGQDRAAAVEGALHSLATLSDESERLLSLQAHMFAQFDKLSPAAQ